MIVRVLPNVTGLDKTFDYSVPDAMTGDIQVGSIVRVDLQNRRVSGWVIALDPPDAYRGANLAPVQVLTGKGPTAEIIELAEWAATRWVARTRQLLVAASPRKAVKGLPKPRRADRYSGAASPAAMELLADGGGVLRLPPTADVMPSILSAAEVGATLVVVASITSAVTLAGRLRRNGLSVALMPHDWAAAAGGVDVVIGPRSAVWAPCPDIATLVVIDEHDESLQEEASPTWHARDVAIERCRRAAVPLLLVSPCPTLSALEWGKLAHPPVAMERRGWPFVDVIDRSQTEPWKRSLLTSELIQHLRDESRVVVCVSNTTGRARLMACRQCRALARCERCAAAVGSDPDEQLQCGRCGLVRPPVCAACGSQRFANLRPGITRLREEIEVAAARPTVLVKGSDRQPPAKADVYVGTEAVLHRVERADTVAFLDFDRELLAPRYRAVEQAMALVVRAARMVGPRAGGGRILLQTFLPSHEVNQALLLADPSRVIAAEVERRRMLQLPPFWAIAEISGSGSDDFVGSIVSDDAVTIAGSNDDYVARAPDWWTLGTALNTGTRPPGARLRIAVDPQR